MVVCCAIRLLSLFSYHRHPTNSVYNATQTIKHNNNKRKHTQRLDSDSGSHSESSGEEGSDDSSANEVSTKQHKKLKTAQKMEAQSEKSEVEVDSWCDSIRVTAKIDQKQARFDDFMNF